MKNKLFVLIGESCSGKTTLEKKIHKEGVCSRAISMTTRKPRTNERDMVDYIFVDNMTFNLCEAQGKFLEITSYNMHNQGNVRYATLRSEVKLDRDNYVCVLNPDGYRQVVESLGKENVVGIYIRRNPKERFLSYLDRENENFNKLLKEANTRYNRDLEDFIGIEGKVDYIIENNGSRENMLEQFREILEMEVNNNGRINATGNAKR